MFTKHIPLKPFIFEHKPGISFRLRLDLNRLGFADREEVRRATTLQGGVREMERDMPNLVFLRLDMPDNAAEQFFERFPARSRPFALILLHAPESDARKQMAVAHVIARQNVAAYLPLGHFSDEDLRKAVENGIEALQRMFFTDNQQEIIDAFVNSLRHPLFKLAEQQTAYNAETLYGQETMLHINDNDNDIEIPWTNVMRLESNKNYFDVWYLDEQAKYRTTIARKDDFQLPPIIHQIHRSHFINLAYIQRFSPTTITLINGDELPLSRGERERLEGVLAELSTPALVLNTIRHNLTENTMQKSKNIILAAKKARGELLSSQR